MVNTCRLKQIGVALRQAFERERDMDLLEIARLELGAAAELRRLRQRRGRAVELAEAPLDLGDHGGVLDRAGRRDHHVGRAIVAREIGAQVLLLERAHGLRRAEDRAADRLVRETRSTCR